jgi:hypothetical protein
MHKKLTARVQKLSRKLPQSAQRFSSALVIEPDNQEALEKSGTLYAVFDIASSTPLDPLLVTKIIHDVLHDSYYTSDAVSPIQSLERAIVNVKDKVTQLPDSEVSSTIDFNILAAALWGNVLYMVQFGKGGSFLVRENAVKPVNSATEGNFSEASGVVRGGDVVILGTEAFIGVYTPEDLVSGVVSFSVADLPEKASALLMKFEAVAEFTEAEKIDFGLQPPKEEKIADKREVKRKKTPASKDKTQTIAEKEPPKLPKITVRSTRQRGVKPIYMVILAVVLLLGTSIYWTLRQRSSTEVGESEVSEETATEEVVEELEAESPEGLALKDSEFNIERIAPEVFYDIKIVDESVSPTAITVLDNSVVVVDENTGKVFTSGIVTPKFSEETSSFPGIRSATYFGGDLVFIDNEGYKVYEDGEVTESYEGESLGPSATYLSFIYSVSGDKLTKYSKVEDTLSGSIWAQSAALEGAVSIAVDGYIYVLKDDGSLLKFFTGVQEDFEITGLDKPLSNPANVVKDINLDNIYVADTGNSRVVVLDEDGNMVKQYLANNDSWSDIKGVGITRDEKTLFVLSGSKVYKVGE